MFKVGDLVNVKWCDKAEEISGIPNNDITYVISGNPYCIRYIDPEGWATLDSEYWGYSWPAQMLAHAKPQKPKWRL